MAFMLDKLDVEAARKVAERAIKSIGMTAEAVVAAAREAIAN